MPLPVILVGLAYFAASAVAGSAAVGVASAFREYKYRKDPDLDFLGTVSSEDLDPLVVLLNEKWNSDLQFCEAFKAHSPNHSKYWKEVACDIQTFGGNTVSNIVRGEGVLYKEILFDVCDRMKVNYNKNAPTHIIEDNFLQKTLSDALENMNEQQRAELLESLSVEGASISGLTKKSAVEIARIVFKSRGFFPYKWSVKVANHTLGALLKEFTGKGLPFAVNSAIPQMAGVVLGPVGTALSVSWTVYDIHGPAISQVGIPSVAYIAMLRKRKSARSQIHI